MTHKVRGRKPEHGFTLATTGVSGTVTLVLQHLITHITGRRCVTVRADSAARGVTLPQTVGEQVVQAASRGHHPLDSNVCGAPLGLEVGLQQIRHWLHEIQRTTIAKVQARPTSRHAEIVA